ncbi:aromatic-ring-hydroxylating dioxygenase subunit beta, partial [Streptomyces alboniger]
MTTELRVDDAAQVRLWHRVSQFLFREARLLDEWRLTEWYDEMLTDDIRYVVPATDVRGEVAGALGLIDDDAARLRQRIEQILNGEVWC